MKKLLMMGVPVILLLALVLSACSSGSTTSPTTSPGTSTSSSTQATSTSSSGTTAGQLATDGQAVFSAHCAKCHGNNGQGATGPTIIGSGQSLNKYSTAQGLYSFISTIMPADAPGSLSAQEYLEVTAFLLLQNGFVSSGQAMDSASLGGIPLTK